MTLDEMWRAIHQLDPAAKLRREVLGGWTVRLPAIVSDPNTGRRVASPRTPFKAQAVERLWPRLLALSEASTLWRQVRAPEGTRYEAVRWNGTAWVPK
jgi:hypothetical protein